jgi:hypothetical protein
VGQVFGRLRSELDQLSSLIPIDSYSVKNPSNRFCIYHPRLEVSTMLNLEVRTLPR